MPAPTPHRAQIGPKPAADRWRAEDAPVQSELRTDILPILFDAVQHIADEKDGQGDREETHTLRRPDTHAFHERKRFPARAPVRHEDRGDQSGHEQRETGEAEVAFHELDTQKLEPRPRALQEFRPDPL